MKTYDICFNIRFRNDGYHLHFRRRTKYFIRKIVDDLFKSKVVPLVSFLTITDVSVYCVVFDVNNDNDVVMSYEYEL